MRNFVFSLFVLFPLFINGQQKFRIRVEDKKSFCGFSVKRGFYNNIENEYIVREAKLGDKSGIPDVINEIKSTLKFNTHIKVYISKDEDNCFASIGPDGIRVIIADQLFLNSVDKTSGTKWAAISIIAHEIGHHIAGFSKYSSKLDSELAADYWSGYILQKLGASREASVKCIMHFGTEIDTSSHPSKYSRADMIRQGWDDGVIGSYDPDKCEICD